MKQLNYLLLIFLCLTFQNCNNDDLKSDNPPDDEPNLIDEQFKSENFGAITSGNFIGSITDAFGVNMSGVLVTIGTKSATTDHNGIFVINNADVYENFAYIKASKEGYIKASRVVIPKEDGVNNIRIVLIKKDVTETVSSGEPSQVSLPNGTKVSFDGNFITENGNPYSGQVDVVLHYLAPNSLNTFLQMPGSLFAQTLNNDARSLETYGMLSVNLFSPSGEPLNINEDNPATLEFPVDVSQTSIAPQTINLWYFDEEQGYWKEQGQATKVGNKYIGEVTHFSWWNCDLPLNYVNLCFSLSPNNTDASTYYQVKIQRQTNNQLIFYGNVLSYDGSECGLIPEGEQLKISIYSTSETCSGELIHEQIVGGFTSDTDIDISFNEEISTTTITGTALNCEGNPITNGYLIVDNQVALSITNGAINFGLQHCSSVSTDILIFDLDTNQWTVVNSVTMTGGTIDLGMLNSCQNTGGVYEGDVILLSQAEVDTFGLFGYTVILGSLNIGSFDTNSDIIDLTSLSSIENIASNLRIHNNSNLASLDGLENVSGFGNDLNVSIHGNSVLESINFNNILSINQLTINNNSSLNIINMESLATIDSIHINSNINLTSVKFNNVITINEFYFINNSMMTNLGEYDNLNSTVMVAISDNESLVNIIDFFDSIDSLDFLSVQNNDSLTSLIGLNNLSTINGDLYINNNDSLISLNGLNGLTNVINLLIFNNDSLSSITDLSNLSNVGESIDLQSNDSLTSLDGLNNITSAYSVVLNHNMVLNSIDALENIITLNVFQVYNCPMLTSLAGIEQITQLDYLYVIESALIDLTDFSNLTTVTQELKLTNNAALTSLDGLNNLASTNIIRIGINYNNGYQPNSNLTDYCALQNLFTNGNYSPENTFIANNAFNPTVQNIIDGNCSQ